MTIAQTEIEKKIDALEKEKFHIMNDVLVGDYEDRGNRINEINVELKELKTQLA